MSGSQEQYDPIPLTCRDALNAWDAGKSVFSVEMGGIGPGYEMSIQGLVFEFLRYVLHNSVVVPKMGDEWPESDLDQLDKEWDSIVFRFANEPWGGFTGAQVNAAKSLAVCVLRRDSYRAALREDAVKDRLIQVCKYDLRSAAEKLAKGESA